MEVAGKIVCIINLLEDCFNRYIPCPNEFVQAGLPGGVRAGNVCLKGYGVGSCNLLFIFLYFDLTTPLLT